MPTQVQQGIVINNSESKVLNPPVSTQHVTIEFWMLREVNHGVNLVLKTTNCQFVPESVELPICSSDWDAVTRLDVQVERFGVGTIENAVCRACVDSCENLDPSHPYRQMNRNNNTRNLTPSVIVLAIEAEGCGHLLPPSKRFLLLWRKLRYERHIRSPSDRRIHFGCRIADRNEFISPDGHPSARIFPTMPTQPVHFSVAIQCLDLESAASLNNRSCVLNRVHGQSSSTCGSLFAQIEQDLDAFLA